MSGKRVAVRIERGHLVYVDGKPYEQGMVVELPADEAQQLLDAGQATRVGRGEKRQAANK